MTDLPDRPCPDCGVPLACTSGRLPVHAPGCAHDAVRHNQAAPQQRASLTVEQLAEIYEAGRQERASAQSAAVTATLSLLAGIYRRQPRERAA